MALSDEVDSALSELESEFGCPSYTWTPCDGSGGAGYSIVMTPSADAQFDQMTDDGWAGNHGGTLLVRKSLITAVSPHRAPENADTITDPDGNVLDVTRVSASRLGGFYRITFSGPEQRT